LGLVRQKARVKHIVQEHPDLVHTRLQATADEHHDTFWGRPVSVCPDFFTKQNMAYEKQQRAIYGDTVEDLDLATCDKQDKLLLRNRGIRKTYSEFQGCLLRRLDGELTPWSSERACLIFSKIEKFLQRYHMIDAEEAISCKQHVLDLFSSAGNLRLEAFLREDAKSLLNFLSMFE